MGKLALVAFVSQQFLGASGVWRSGVRLVGRVSGAVFAPDEVKTAPDTRVNVAFLPNGDRIL